MDIGEQIKKYRKEANLSQKELGYKLGVSQQHIAQYENGKRIPKLESLERIAGALNVDVWELYENYPLRERTYKSGANFLDEKLLQVGCKIGFEEDDLYLWIEFPDGTLEVTEKQLQELDEDTMSYLRFKLGELRTKNRKNFRKK